MYDVIVVGGGPAGITAAAIAINQRMDTLVIARKWGGQTTYTMKIEDTEGREVIGGETLLDAFRRQLDYLDFVRHFASVEEITPQDKHFSVRTDKGEQFKARALIIATGASPQRLDVPGEGRLSGYGLSYSATTHASLFLGKDVAVVGYGRRAQFAVADLARKAHHVYMLAPQPLVETTLVNKIRQMDNVEVFEQVVVKEIGGERFVESISFTTAQGEERTLPVKGVFVKLPRKPNSELVRHLVECDERGHIVVDVYCATSYPGIFAAGDVTHVSEQVLVHIGEGAKAAISAYQYVLTL